VLQLDMELLPPMSVILKALHCIICASGTRLHSLPLIFFNLHPQLNLETIFMQCAFYTSLIYYDERGQVTPGHVLEGVESVQKVSNQLDPFHASGEAPPTLYAHAEAIIPNITVRQQLMSFAQLLPFGGFPMHQPQGDRKHYMEAMDISIESVVRSR
jgi:hypothetical protein